VANGEKSGLGCGLPAMSLPERLCLLFTPGLCRGETFETLSAAIDGGVDLVQWRSKEADAEGFRRCQQVCRRAGVRLIVNDDVMLAVRSRADGAHVGQDDLPAEAARKLLVGQILGVSTHDLAQIDAAAAAGADYIGFGPCHPTPTKGYTTGRTATEIADAVAAAAAARLPLFAVGGITAGNLLPLRGLGIDRIAVASAILASDDPRAAARALRRLL
jgi:thiamine-phosphate pyrophosphorylase